MVNQQPVPNGPRSQMRGFGILLALALLFAMALGVALLIPLRMCPVLEKEWTESILWTQVDPKMDDKILAQLQGQHRSCKVCGGTEKVPLFKESLYRSGSSENPRWVMVASITIASDEDVDEAENTCILIEAILSKAGIPSKVPPSTHGTGVFVPEQEGEKAIRIISGDQQARKNHKLTVITKLRKGPHR